MDSARAQISSRTVHLSSGQKVSAVQRDETRASGSVVGGKNCVHRSKRGIAGKKETRGGQQRTIGGRQRTITLMPDNEKSQTVSSESPKPKAGKLK
jgi:hypothetical protein